MSDENDPRLVNVDKVKDISRVQGYRAVDVADEALLKNTGICPDCGITVIKQYRAVDTWTCHYCKKSFHEVDLVKE